MHHPTETEEAALWHLTPHGWVFGSPKKGNRVIRHRAAPLRHLPKAAGDWGKRGVFSEANQYRDLEFLALKLNDDPDSAWRIAAEIVTAPTPTDAAARFNGFALGASFHLHVSVDDTGNECLAELVADRAVPFGKRQAIRAVWDSYFRSPHRERLKRCAGCARFFVDYARPNNSVRCSKGCTWRWWNRGRRRTG
jgi:hypothetical protein